MKLIQKQIISAVKETPELTEKQLIEVNGGQNDLPPWITPTLPEEGF